MIHKDFHPLFFTDIDAIQNHIPSVTEDSEAALRRVDEIDFFKPVISAGYVRYLLASFGGQNWSALAEDRL